MTRKITSKLQITAPESLKRKQVSANGKEWGNGRPEKISRTLEVRGNDQNNDRDMEIIDLAAMEEDRIVDKPTEDSNVHNVEFQSHLTSPDPEPTSNFDFFLNMPDIPFIMFAMMLSITQLRRLTQVSSSLKKKITENILENPARKNDLRARIRRAMKQYPSNEDISNAKWLSEYRICHRFSL